MPPHLGQRLNHAIMHNKLLIRRELRPCHSARQGVQRLKEVDAPVSPQGDVGVINDLLDTLLGVVLAL